MKKLLDIYSTNKVKLTPLLSADSNILFKWINDPELVHYNASYLPIDDISHKEWFELVRKNNSVRIFAIRKTDDDHLVGTCQLHSINLVHRMAELQIRIGENSEQQKGFGTDAVKLLLQFGFKELGLNRIYLHVFQDNKRAVNVYEKAGMKIEGKLREAAFINGSFKNILILSILKNDFSS